MPPIIFIVMDFLSAIAQGTENLINRGQSVIDSHTNYKRQKKLMNYQNQFNIQQWERENEYNLPSNIRKRLEDAGINPYTAMSGAQSSPVSSIAGVGLGSAPTPSAPHTGSIADALMNARMTASNIKVNEAQEQKILAERDKAQAEKEEIISRTPKEHNTGDVQNRYTISQTPTEKNTGDVQNEYTTALTEGQRISNVLNRAKIRFADQTAEQEFELLCYNVINQMLDGDLKRATAQKMLADALLANSQAAGQKTSNAIAQRTANQLIERTNTENLYWTRQANYGAAQGASPINISIATGEKIARHKNMEQEAYNDVNEFNERENSNREDVLDKLYRKELHADRFLIPKYPRRFLSEQIKLFRTQNPYYTKSKMSDEQVRKLLTRYYTKLGRYNYRIGSKKYIWAK